MPPNAIDHHRRCRLALFLMSDGDYFDFVRGDCQRAAGIYGFEVEVFCADNDSETQIAQIQACLRAPEDEQKAAVLVWPVLESALADVAYEATAQNVGWVMLNRHASYMFRLRERCERLPIFSVGADQREIGRIQGRQFKAMLPDGGELLYIRGPAGTSSAIRRWEGTEEVLRDSAIRVVFLQADWTAQGGAQAMTSWLKAARMPSVPDIVVGAQNDAMAMGARAALEEAGVIRSNSRRVRIAGCDGSPTYGRRLVREGTLAATVVMPPPAGVAVREIAATLARGKPRLPAEILMSPSAFPEPECL
jgi:ABC-type sugar transport system substrate-binding protein